MTIPNEVLCKMPPADGLAKIIVQTHRDQRGLAMGAIVAREDTGQVIGSAVNGGVRFGTEVVIDLFFVTQRHALTYIKELCKVYLNRSDVDFIVEESDVPLVMPAQKQTRLV